MSTSDIETLINNLRDSWVRQGASIQGNILNNQIEKFQKQYDVLLPEDFKNYLRVINGMKPGETDSEHIRFWPLGEVKPFLEEVPDSNERQYAGYFVFADYSVWAHAYAIKLTNKADDANHVSLVGGDKPVQLANSFSEFIFLYLNHIESIL